MGEFSQIFPIPSACLCRGRRAADIPRIENNMEQVGVVNDMRVIHASGYLPFFALVHDDTLIERVLRAPHRESSIKPGQFEPT